MAKEDRASSRERGSALNITRMRTPFTADVPDEFNEAQWIPDVKTLPDASHDPDVVPLKNLDPLGHIPRGRRRE